MARDTRSDQLARLQRQLSAQQQLIDKLKLLHALHIVAYNAPTAIEKTAVEFFYAVGDVFEGHNVDDLKITAINREEVKKELTDG